MNITINIQAPELANAIASLAAALSNKPIQSIVSLDGKAIASALTQETQQQQPTNVVPFQHQQQPPTAVPTAPLQHAPIQQQPIQQAPVQQQAPTQQQPVQQQTVPTNAPTYTMDQLAVAATQLMDAGRQSELLSLLAAFGAQSLMALPKEQYGAFATKLREMGAKI